MEVSYYDGQGVLCFYMKKKQQTTIAFYTRFAHKRKEEWKNIGSFCFLWKNSYILLTCR